MLDREIDNMEASNQIEISVVSSSKQDQKAEKPNQGLKRPSQIENKEENEAKTQEEPEEVAGHSDLLNIVFSYFDSRFQEIQNQIRKNKDKKPAEKKQDLFINVQTDIHEILDRHEIPHLFIYSDASSTGLASVYKGNGKLNMCKKNFNVIEETKSLHEENLKQLDILQIQ